MTSNHDSLNSSGFNTSNIEQKKEYHKLLDKLSLLDDDAVDNKQRVNDTLQVLDEARSLATAATANTSVVLLDSYLLRQAGQQALTAAANIEVNTNVYIGDELAQHVAENPSFWQFSLPRRAPSAATLHGTFEPTPPPPSTRAPRRRVAAQQAAVLSKPANIAVLDNVQEDTAMVRKVRQFIKGACRRGPLSYLHCVLHPTSFERSVHNIYYVAFLVRDGEVAVYVDEEHGIPMIRTVAHAQRTERDISQENQFIVTLDMARWRKLVESCGIKEPLMGNL